MAIAQTKSNSSISYELKSKLNGVWFSTDAKTDKYKSVPSFEIKGDTFFGIGQIEKYKMKISVDSTLTMHEILTKTEQKTIKPKVTLPKKIYKLTNDSLVLSAWLDGNKKYERYYKTKKNE